MIKGINRFIDQLNSGTKFEDSLMYTAGKVIYDGNIYKVAFQQYGAEETFSVGQPVYDKDNNLLGYLGVGLYSSLDYGQTDIRVPVEHWQICLPTRHCADGKTIYTYWQMKGAKNEH